MVFLAPPDDQWRKIYGIVQEAQALALAEIHDGAPIRDVDAAARGRIADAGYGENFGHGLGHGVGLQVHEGPTLNAKSEETLLEGMIVTVEPGIYLPGWGGVRIEDLVCVRKDGAEVLTSVPKEIDAAILG
jgi:Xaa-Pro aminopeptidase